MAQPPFKIDTPLAYHLAQRDILLRLDAGADAEHVRSQWKDTIDRIVDTRLDDGDALVFVTTPEHGQSE
ncbi:hypothetical protein [Rhodococcus sp. DMU1]|uniref:hypothetical protein n=1 Tax=Rhodococcus sp. DMU1 TaxID=2722825 RepID=UPI00143E533A|nr:hypothetical protein [Rhodococcus sp. DMU1]QIX53953.1 hypothetical protein HFP48_30895 [Rhodococcus sp. DMU1]